MVKFDTISVKFDQKKGKKKNIHGVNTNSRLHGTFVVLSTTTVETIWRNTTSSTECIVKLVNMLLETVARIQMKTYMLWSLVTVTGKTPP